MRVPSKKGKVCKYCSPEAPFIRNIKKKNGNRQEIEREHQGNRIGKRKASEAQKGLKDTDQKAVLPTDTLNEKGIMKGKGIGREMEAKRKGKER